MGSRVIAIDGPAGSGKSTTARAVADRLGLVHRAGGARYRAATLAAVDDGVEFSGQRIVCLVQSLPVGLSLTEEGFRVEAAGVDVSGAIRCDRVTARVSEVSALPEVRDWVNAALRSAAAAHPRGVVMDGRDIGTVVFPDALLKIYLTAASEERARRRLSQLGRATDRAAVVEAAAELGRRDTADAGRAVAPLSVAADAVVLDTTDLGFDEQVERVIELARKVFS